MTKPLSEADLIFPHLSNTPNLSSTLSSLRRSTLSIHNRLASIVHDSAFVASVATAYSLPLVANERCGSWYIPPDLKRGSVYFKSTDGHMGQWQFSLRRLNLQLLDVVQQRGGAVVVDSTRRGKSMPDALSKTVPIWCCVINRVVFGTEGDKGMLRTPPSVVGQSEYAQMDERIDGFVKSFLVSFVTTRASSILLHANVWICRMSANQISLVCAQNYRSRSGRYGSRKDRHFQMRRLRFLDFILSFYAQHQDVFKAPKHQRMVMCRVLRTITRPGLRDLHQLYSGSTKIS